jgi:hypothetical protein
MAMITPERQLEGALVTKLRDLKYEYRPDIGDRATLEANFREKFEGLNRVTLTDGEFQRLLDEIVTPHMGRCYADTKARLRQALNYKGLATRSRRGISVQATLALSLPKFLFRLTVGVTGSTTLPGAYSFSKPRDLNFSVRQFSVTMRCTCSAPAASFN